MATKTLTVTKNVWVSTVGESSPVKSKMGLFKMVGWWSRLNSCRENWEENLEIDDEDKTGISEFEGILEGRLWWEDKKRVEGMGGGEEEEEDGDEWETGGGDGGGAAAMEGCGSRL